MTLKALMEKGCDDDLLSAMMSLFSNHGMNLQHARLRQP
jgi:hypothetical protein